MNRFSLIYPAMYVLTLFTLPNEINGQTGTWQSIGPEGISYSSIIKYDQLSKKLYILGYQKIFSSDNNGNSWIDISPGLSGDYIK